METTQIFHEIPQSNVRFPVLFTGSKGIDLGFQDTPETPISSPEPVQFLALSPTISSLDHQEVVATANSLDSVIGTNTATEATDLFSFELESNGIPADLKNISDSSVLDEDCWFDLIDTSNVSGELNDIQLSPIPQTTSALEPVQPTMSKLQLIRPITDLCPSIPCPTPSVVFPTKSKPEHRRERKTSPSVRLKLSDIEDFDAEDLELDFAGDRENEDGLSDSDSTDSPHKIDRAALVRPHAGSITWPKKYLHNEDIINGKPGQRVQLSTEEIKMLRAMGVQMPARFPLNQVQERALRTVRRKIRNKLSAQASRARRQEYVADLEYRVQLSDKENERLRRQVAHLQNDKRDLIAHVRRLRSYVAKFLYKDEKTTLLPLFTRPVRESNHSMKSATQAATAAAGGTSLLIVTFMILGWTAPVLVSPSKNASSHTISAAQPNSVFAYFPGESFRR
ncbi:putative camp-response element binding protein [Fasciolopsis buskii]|uniref:Putative camp-response element binding protein n=1 Tax=Fasciolopsis buskii TaxID=27845 RepID=A0A8E0S1T4_9TREM|nr:putative camp-response element binding protein [Fasciolopsis buski]